MTLAGALFTFVSGLVLAAISDLAIGLEGGTYWAVAGLTAAAVVVGRFAEALDRRGQA